MPCGEKLGVFFKFEFVKHLEFTYTANCTQKCQILRILCDFMNLIIGQIFTCVNIFNEIFA